MKSWNQAAVVVFLITIAFLATNCAASSPTAASPTPSTGPLDGTWSTLFSGDSPSEVSKGPGGHQIMGGTWMLIFSGTSLRIRNPEHHDVQEVRVVLTESRLEIPPDPGCFNQTTATAGVYQYTVSGSSLTFTMVSDSCADRATTLTAYPWTKIA